MPNVTDGHKLENPTQEARLQSAVGAQKPFFKNLVANMLRPSVRQAAVVIADQGFCSIAHFLTGVLVARACSKAEFGIYVVGFTLLTTAMSIQANLCGTPYTVFSPSLDSKDRKFYLGSTLIQHLAVSFLATVGFIIAAAVVFTTGRTDSFAGVLLALGVASGFILLQDFMRYVLLAQLRVWASLLMGLAVSGFTVGMLFWAYVGQWLTASVAYFIMAGCSGLPVLFVLLRERKQIAFATNKLRQHLKENWKFGKWLIAHTGVFFFSAHVFMWFLIGLRDASEAGVYGICVSAGAILNPLLVGIFNYLGPKAAHAACNGFREIQRQVFTSMVMVIIIMSIAIFFVYQYGELFIVKLYGMKYIGTGTYLTIYFLSVIFAAESALINAGLNAMKKPSALLASQSWGLVFTLSIGLCLVYEWGILGAVIGITLSKLVVVVYKLSAFRALREC